MAYPLDMRPLRRALPVSAVVTASPSESYPIKVLLWNIHGETAAGCTQARQDIVPPIIRRINPDVLLLQETSNRILVNSIMDPRSGTREYKDTPTVGAGETRIIYDAKKYIHLPNTDKQFTQDDSRQKMSLNDVLRKGKQEIFRVKSTKLRDEKLPVLKTAIELRISVACFKKKGSPRSPTVIFISFHNFNTSEGADVRARCVEGLCRLVSIIKRLTGCVVLAGADFNQQLICPCPCPCTSPYRTILDYTPTERRLKSGQIDYFILDPPDCIKIPVKPLDLKHVKLASHSRLTKEQVTTFWKCVLNHDPLVCTIKANMD